MNIAIVYDRVNKFGGAERVLLALHEIWPEAPLFTAVYDAQKASWSKLFKIKTSFMKFLPFSATKHEIFSLLTPYAFESFNFDTFDVVLSVTSSDAKSIITKPGTLHICYCLTPTRYLWSGYNDYLREPGVGIFNPIARLCLKYAGYQMKDYDYISSFRPDYYISISKTVRERIKKYYKRESEIIYPPVNTNIFRPKKNSGNSNKNYFLIVSRLVPYKKIDYAIKVFNKIGKTLKIVGYGIDEGRLRNISGRNIEFIGGNLTDEKLCCYYQECKALIFPGEEDFGIAAVEAQACGKPVIGYLKGGLEEIVTPGKTGELYKSQDENNIIRALSDFRPERYSSNDCRLNALKFSKSIFQKSIKTKVNQYWKSFQIS